MLAFARDLDLVGLLATHILAFQPHRYLHRNKVFNEAEVFETHCPLESIFKCQKTFILLSCSFGCKDDAFVILPK